MPKWADGGEAALMTLLRAIVARDRREVSRLLRESPELARRIVSTGATRAVSTDYFFDEITHYVYAGDTALHIAGAAYERDVAEALVTRGANPGARNRRGAEPLHYAADGLPDAPHWNPDAQSATIAYLIGAGADPNSPDKSGVAPLHRAVRTRCAAAVRALLAHGADPIRRNASGSTPLHLAVQTTGRGDSGSPAAREQQEMIVALLLDHGARPSDTDARGKTVEEAAGSDRLRGLLRRA
jgi:ankyrin repeat protein